MKAQTEVIRAIPTLDSRGRSLDGAYREWAEYLQKEGGFLPRPTFATRKALRELLKRPLKTIAEINEVLRGPVDIGEEMKKNELVLYMQALACRAQCRLPSTSPHVNLDFAALTGH